MRADGTEKFASLLSVIAESTMRSAEASGQSAAHLSHLVQQQAHLVQQQAAFRTEMLAKLDGLASPRADQAKPPTSSSPLSVEALAKFATNLTTIAAAVAKVWGPALVVAAAIWRVLWPWLRSVLGLG